MKSKTRKTVNIIVHTAAIAFLAFLTILFVSSKISGNPIFLFGKTAMWVITDSMSPSIPARTYILVEKTDPNEVKVGDVIAFVSTDPRILGQINTHRVVGVENDRFITKGDNNPTDDGAYSAKKENVVGKVVRTLPVMTFFGRILMSDAGFVVIISIFMAVVLICYVPDIKNALKNKDESPQLDEKTKREIDKLVEEEMKKIKESSPDGSDDL